MPLQLELTPDNRSIELQEYVDIMASKHYDLSSHDDIIDSAKYLQQLNNNKHFIVDEMCRELKDFSSFQKSNLYGPQVLILHSNENYFLRAVVWNPISKLERSLENFKYDICHDHNFDILTAGYCGPGYESRSYTYDKNEVRGVLGEKVTLTPQGIVTLSEGKVMLYRAKKDIHIQLPPESLSVSLNLIPRSEKIKEPQYQFDESTHRLCRFIHSTGSELVVRMAGVLGDENFVDVLQAIFTGHPSSRVKAFAAHSMVQIIPECQGEISDQVLGSNDPVLKNIYDLEMKKSGASFELI